MKSFRTNKMGSLIRNIASDMIANKVQDPRISRFVSITRVEVAPDLQLARIFVSVMGTEEVQRSTMRGLQSAKGLIQRAVAKGVTARTCPQLMFVADSTIKKTAEIMELINQNAEEMERDALQSADGDGSALQNSIAQDRIAQNPITQNPITQNLTAQNTDMDSTPDDGVQP